MTRLNLLLDDEAGFRSGYLNCDPLGVDGREGWVRAGPTGLAGIVDPGSCQELVALNILPYLKASLVEEALNEWVSLLAHGGKITLSAPDCLDQQRLLYLGVLSPDQYNALIYGPQDRPWRYIQSGHSAQTLAEALSRRGLAILLKRIGGGRAVVVAQRP
jgi:hypothetical protein